MTTAQVLFAIALGAISLIIVLFAAYVINTSRRGDRWVRPPGKRPPSTSDSVEAKS